MTKFVKKGCNFVKRQQGGFGRCRFGEVTNDGYMRPLLPTFASFLPFITGHPSAVSLTRTWEKISIKYRHMIPGFIFNLISLYVRMVYRYVSVWDKFQIIQFASCCKYPLNNFFQLKIGFQQFVIHLIFLFFQLF